jgi:hypothetical protein
MARVEQAVKDNITPDTRIIAVMEWNINEREGYQEREYMVAWMNDKEGGTHRVHIDSEDRSALFIGHYMQTPGDAVTSFYKRIGVKD